MRLYDDPSVGLSLFWENMVNIKAADALVPYITKWSGMIWDVLGR